MFNKNYYMAYAAWRANKSSDVIGAETTDGKPKLITVSGNVASDTYQSTYNYDSVSSPVTGITSHMSYVRKFDVSKNISDSSSSNQFSYGVVFGTDNTPASFNDYRLAGSCITNITCSSKNNTTYAEDGSSTTVSYTYTITNDSDVEITIGEVGMFSQATWQTGGNTSSAAPTRYTHFNYMYERTALDTPVTIPAGGVGQVVYTIHFNYPVS